MLMAPILCCPTAEKGTERVKAAREWLKPEDALSTDSLKFLLQHVTPDINGCVQLFAELLGDSAPVQRLPSFRHSHTATVGTPIHAVTGAAGPTSAATAVQEDTGVHGDVISHTTEQIKQDMRDETHGMSHSQLSATPCADSTTTATLAAVVDKAASPLQLGDNAVAPERDTKRARSDVTGNFLP